ncbi:hypothetical protein ACFLXZ_00415 [Chloroflexota bacterium]
MDKKEFSQVRHYLGKTQNEVAKLICVSLKAIQSFEQGWRKISASRKGQLQLSYGPMTTRIEVHLSNSFAR